MSDDPPIVVFASICCVRSPDEQNLNLTDTPTVRTMSNRFQPRITRWPSQHQPAKKGHFIDTLL